MFLDLHSHSTHSDGTKTPLELIKKAKELNLKLYSITDHDNINAQKEAMEYAKEYDLNYITGVEISTNFDRMLDILGYDIDLNDENLNETLNEIQNFRKNRNNLMIEKLKNLNIIITIEELKEVAGSEIIGRPHFAKVMVDKKYVKNRDEAFEKYLGDGKKGNVEKKKILPKQAIELINNAGGKAVLAHPKYLKMNENRLREFLKELKSYGLWGVEAYYSTNLANETKLFIKIAKELDLNLTIGSDYHGDNKPDISLGMELEEEKAKNIIKSFGGEF